MPNITVTIHQSVLSDARVFAACIAAFQAAAKSDQSTQN
jgi:hypothetical protein